MHLLHELYDFSEERKKIQRHAHTQVMAFNFHLFNKYILNHAESVLYFGILTVRIEEKKVFCCRSS